MHGNGTLTTLLFDGGYVSLDFIRPFLAMPKLKLASLWSFGLTKTFAKTGTGANATYTPTYHFYMKDHLGSNRIVASASGVAEQVNHYYPYGSTFYGETTTDHRFKYCGRSALWDAFETTWGKKELDEETGLYYYGARYYDPRLSMWLGTNPMQEDCKGKSTHNYYKRHIYEKVYDAKTFAKYLDVYDRGWKKSNNGKPIVILHSCKTSDFAKKLSSSAEFKDIYVIAPNEVLSSSILGESVAGGGLWLVYRNGEQVKGKSGEPITYDSNAQVGTIGFDYGF